MKTGTKPDPDPRPSPGHKVRRDCSSEEGEDGQGERR